MAEAEELLTDAARHATIFARDLWRRHRTAPEQIPTVGLTDLASRLDLLISSVFGTSYPIRIAQRPARPTLLALTFKKVQKPYLEQAIPATNGESIWLPPDSGTTDRELALEFYRACAMQQAMRAQRGSAKLVSQLNSSLLTDIYLLLEANAADNALAVLLPGLKNSINRMRGFALAARPPLSAFSPPRQRLENFLREILKSDCGQRSPATPRSESPSQSLTLANEILVQWQRDNKKEFEKTVLLKDLWTGELRAPPSQNRNNSTAAEAESVDDHTRPRSSHLDRRPEIRQAKPDEDKDSNEPGALMIQVDEPHKHAEDPMGLQRPVDRDEDMTAEEYGDLVSELAEARLVSTPGKPKEVLLSDDPPEAQNRLILESSLQQTSELNYPEWNYRTRIFENPGATVRSVPPQAGPQQWVDRTLAEHQSMLDSIRRSFETLRARRVVHHKQLDGDDIDLDAWITSYANFRAGSPMAETLYQTRRSTDRSIAITLLIDISGSTDSWVSNNRRIIDVEREALLLVCIALEGMGEPYSVIAFSGEGRHAVSVRQIKGFNEHYSNDIALRISALEPERYTRTGAALRHATANLMKMPAAHRLLLLLSDGKPNDNDDYEGRYGVEDMHMAVTEARLQNIFPFCLTIDRHAANYLPRIFGNNQYALLPKPEQLPKALLDWMKRLVAN